MTMLIYSGGEHILSRLFIFFTYQSDAKDSRSIARSLSMTDLTEDQSSPSMVLAQPAHEEHHPGGSFSIFENAHGSSNPNG